MSTTNSTDQELPANWEDLAEQAEPVESSEDDELVCPRCFTPFEPSGHSSQPTSHMCLNCGGPISGVALWDPISRIWGEGFGYRQITRVGSEPKLAHVIGVWIIFVPGMLSSLGYFLSFSKLVLDYLVVSRPSFAPSPFELLANILGLLLMTFVFAIQIAIVRRVTLNYLRKKPTEQPTE
jgi:hypothetical protein